MRRGRAAGIALLVLVGGWLVAGVVTAVPASAHASLVSSTPADGARLSSPPGTVTLEFSEHVSLGPGYAHVLDSTGGRVDTGRASAAGDVVTIPLRGTLPRGAYVVTYRVISADSHPVEDAYSFAVGNVPLVSAQSVAAQPPTNTAVAFLLPVARWIGYAGLALSIGVPVLLLVCWPAGWRAPLVRRFTLWGAGGVAVGALAGYLLQGPYTAGSGLGSVFQLSLLETTAGSEAGVLFFGRLVCGLALLVVLADTWRSGEPPGLRQVVAGGVLGVVVVGTTAGIGHAVAGQWAGFAFVSTFVHVAAMTVWLGGLAGLLLGVLRRGVPLEEMVDVLPRFSRLAFGAVSALVVTGIIQAVREVTSPAALFTTEYGQLLVAKLAVVVVVLGAAAVSRVWVQQHLGAGHRPDGRRRVTAHAFAASDGEAVAVGPADAAGGGSGLPERVQREATAALPALRRSVLVELALAVAIIALSAVLVGEAPASAAAAPQPIDRTLVLRGTSGTYGSVEVSVAPAAKGTNSLHVYLFDSSGQPAQPRGIEVGLSDPAAQIGPIDVKLLPAGPGHFTADAMSIPGDGTWTLTVTVRVDEFTAATAATSFPVR